MDIQTSQSAWQGIIPPMVTPLLGQDDLGTAGLERLADSMRRIGLLK